MNVVLSAIRKKSGVNSSGEITFWFSLIVCTINPSISMGLLFKTGIKEYFLEVKHRLHVIFKEA
jgi:hypothetical protein